MALFLRNARALLGAAAVATAGAACYPGGGGSNPPLDSLYFPVGLAVSPDGSRLYVVNSDFDLQYNGGTLQSYDLQSIRNAAVGQIADGGACAEQVPTNDFLGLGCAPPQPVTAYLTSSVVIGAFAADLQLSLSNPKRLFAPIRGETAVLFADVDDQGNLSCPGGNGTRCASGNYVGNDPNAPPANTRHSVMSGEPFGIAQTLDGTAIVVTSDSDTTASVLSSGIPASSADGAVAAQSVEVSPSLQYVLSGLPFAGTGIAAIPHDRALNPPPCETSNEQLGCLRPAFLETNHSTAEIDLLRYYSDDDSLNPSGNRPFLQREGAFPLTATTGSDERGIAIDDSPRSSCRASGGDDSACAILPARVFVASRTPPALVLGEVGTPPSNYSGSFDPDLLTIVGTVPLPSGPSRVYRAPVIDRNGNYSLRIFVTCFDSDLVVVYDPETRLWDSIHVGRGPFAMAFDPFPTDAYHPNDSAPWGQAAPSDRPYRFAYVASFTESFVEVIDLDNSRPMSPSTYETVVFALGEPMLPKGQ